MKRSSVYAVAVVCVSVLSGCSGIKALHHKLVNKMSADPHHACHCFPPQISQMYVTSITATSAVVNFTCELTHPEGWINPKPYQLNYGGTGQIKYGLSRSAVNTLYPNVNYQTLPIIKYNSIVLTGLTPNTTYYYQPWSYARQENGQWYYKPRQTVGIQDDPPNVTIQSFRTLPAGALYSISGTVRTSTGGPVAQVTMTLSGAASRTTQTDANGAYSFGDLAQGDYTVTPSRTGWSFAPASRSYTPLTSTQTAQDFTATPPAPTYVISGYVRDAQNNGISGVTVTLSGAGSRSTTTGTSGAYAFTGLSSGTYTVTPSRTGYVFTPASRSYSPLDADQVNQNFTGAAITYAIGGTVRSTAGVAMAGVTVTLSGAASRSTTTAANGTYQFVGLTAGGTFTVTPSQTGYSFAPSSRTYANLSSTQTAADFSGTVLLYSISGYVRDAQNSGISGVTVTLSGAGSGSVVTGTDGSYAFTGLPAGNYTVTPSLAGYAFNPANRAYSPLSSNQVNQNFAGTPVSVTYSISGTVRVGGSTPLEGVTVTLTGAASGTYVTGADGTYTFANLPGGTYTVAPSRAGYVFTPANRSYSPLSSNQTMQDFSATAQTYTISGYVRDAQNSGISGVTVTLSGAASAEVVTGADGSYSFSGLTVGDYQVTPSRTGWAFSPPSRSYSPLAANQTNQNFTGSTGGGVFYSISGYVRDLTGMGVPDVTMSLTGAASATVQTTASGFYEFTGLASGNYTLVPSRAGYSFSPPARSYTPLSADLVGQDFTGTAGGLVISDVEVTDIEQQTVIILWKTDKPATSQVEYWPSTVTAAPHVLAPAQPDPNLVTVHVVRLYALSPNTRYTFFVKSSTGAGAPEVLSAQHEFMTRQPGTGGAIINNERTFNTPNPCKTRTSFQYTLNRPVDSVTITVYTLNGSKVVELRGTELYAGTNMLPWDLRDSSGNRIANGLYIYQVKVKAGFVEESVKKTNLIVVH